MTKKPNSRADPTDGPSTNPETRWRQIAQRHYDPDRDSELTTTIIDAIAEAEDVAPEEIKSPTLYESIDVAAVEDALFDSKMAPDAEEGTGTVEFRYDEYRITIRSDGWVQVYETVETSLS